VFRFNNFITLLKFSIDSVLETARPYAQAGSVKFNKNGKPDMRYKKNRELYLETGRNLDGSLDMRILINRQKNNDFILENYKK